MVPRMGHNESRNTFKRTRLGLDLTAQQAVDEYKARSVWAAWWSLDEKVRRRHFTRVCDARRRRQSLWYASPATDSRHLIAAALRKRHLLALLLPYVTGTSAP
jgi:hypothetical protein